MSWKQVNNVKAILLNFKHWKICVRLRSHRESHSYVYKSWMKFYSGVDEEGLLQKFTFFLRWLWEFFDFLVKNERDF